MKNILTLLLLIPIGLLGQNSNATQKMSLEQLNEYVFTEYALKKNIQPLQDIATDDFILIAAPGMIENKKQAIAGVTNIEISSVNVTVDEIVTSQNFAIIVGVLEMKGTIMKRPVPAKIRYSNTFVKIDGIWRLQMRTMTPMRG